MGLIIGVDGGGTKTTYVVYDSTRSVIRRFTGESINFHAKGIEKACTAFRESMLNIKAEMGRTADSIFVGNAALGIGENPDAEHPFLQCAASFSGKCRMSSDLYIGLKGIDASPAIFLISGTGSMAIAEDKSGNLYSAGGWGYILGDQGSGYYIGIRGIREAIKSHERFTGPTSLVDRMIRFFNVDRIEQIIEKTYNPQIGHNVIAKFAADVLSAAENGDNASAIIVDTAIGYLLKHVIVLHDRIGGIDSTLGVYGGCFQKSGYFFSRFREKMSEARPNIHTGFPKYAPDEAALILAGELIGVRIGSNILSATT